MPPGDADRARRGRSRRWPPSRGARRTRTPPTSSATSLLTLLLWLERWYDGARTERRDADDAEVQLHRRFTAPPRGRLRRATTTPPTTPTRSPSRAPALARALVELTGRTTKELITDRVMLEAARLLRFSDRTVGEVAFQVGFRDPLYFSRAFKRHTGRSPQAYRDAARGA